LKIKSNPTPTLPCLQGREQGFIRGNIMRRLLIILLCLLPTALFAYDSMHMDMPKEPPLGASAAFDSHGRLWVVDVSNGHVRLRHSDNDGHTLSAPVLVNPVAEPIYAEGENRPKLVFGPHDAMYISWSQPRAKPWTGFVRFARSNDRGEHFSTPLTVHHDRAEITHRFDAMAVDGKGRIVIAWIDKRDEEAASRHGKPYLGAAVYYSWSSDDGASFVPEKKLIDQSCECCRIALAHTPDGEVAAFFRSIYGDNIRDHAYAVLHTDGHASHADRATYSEWKIEGCPHHGPGLAIGSDGTRHAVWYEAKDKPTIWYGQLDPGHAPRHSLMIANAGASHADVAAHDRDVWVVWNQVSNNGYALMLRSSTDGGAHFDSPREIAHSNDAVASPQLLRKKNSVFVAWNTVGGFRLIPIEAAR
jgi:hypothetical protein